MRKNTILTLGASASFGLLAVFLARGWLTQATDNEFAIANTEPSVAFDTIPVLVATTDLQFGDEIHADNVELVDYPSENLPEGIFNSLETLFISPEERTIALSPIRAFEPIMDYRVSGPGARGTFSTRILDGMRASTIRVNETTGVGGHILPGDYVDIFHVKELSQPSESFGEEEPVYTSELLFESIKVLGVDLDANALSENSRVASTITVEVTNQQAQLLTLAKANGQLSLTLRSAGDVVETPALSKAFKRFQAEQAQGPRLKTKISTAADPDSGLAQVTVIRGFESGQVKVVNEGKGRGGDVRLAGG